jgi:hypothetical protein
LRRSRPRSPDRQTSIERRRAVAGSGMLPPWLRKRCTQGVAAGLTVMANACKRGRPCEMPVAKIAGLAGVCHTLGQEAMRVMRCGLGRVIPRRQPGRANLPNSVEIIDPDWRAWIELRRQGADLDRGFDPPQHEEGGLRKISPAGSNTYRPKSTRIDSVAPSLRPAHRDLPAWFTDFRASLPP